jgi:hypothetical protein
MNREIKPNCETTFQLSRGLTKSEIFNNRRFSKANRFGHASKERTTQE